MQQESDVVLYIYDLSKGMLGSFKRFSTLIFSAQHDAIYHTSIVVFGREYFFSGGICSAPPGTTDFGTPIDKLTLGKSKSSEVQFHKFLKQISPEFTHEKYHVFKNNCNNFSNRLTNFLLFKNIPDKYLSQARETETTLIGGLYQIYSEFQKGSAADQAASESPDLPAIPVYDPKTTKLILLNTYESFERLRAFKHKVVLILFDRTMPNWAPYLGVLSEAADRFPEIGFYLAEKSVLKNDLEKFHAKELPTVVLFVGQKEVKRTNQQDVTFLRKLFNVLAADKS